MTTTQLRQLSGYELNSMALAGTIALSKVEKLDAGWYCGTWYCFATLTGEKIKDVYVPSGFGI